MKVTKSIKKSTTPKAPAAPESPYEVIEGEYNGNPMIRIYDRAALKKFGPEDEQKACIIGFGMRKATAISACTEEIAAFVRRHAKK